MFALRLSVGAGNNHTVHPTQDNEFRVFHGMCLTILQEVRDKVVLVLNHINKRLRVLPSATLPVEELVAEYGNADPSATSAIQTSFTLMYIDKGCIFISSQI